MQIFESEEDYYYFLSTLQFAREQFAQDGKQLPDLCSYYAYALMGNHVHLIVQVRDASIGEIIKRIASSYVYYFNRKYGRDGHLFKERFRSEPCEDLSYFITLLRYIHQNPVKAGLARRVDDYAYTSWHEYLDDIESYVPLCNTRAVLKRIGLDELKDLVEEPLADDVFCLDHEDMPNRCVSDETLLNYLQQELGIQDFIEIQRFEKSARNEIILLLVRRGGGVRQLSRLTGLGIHIIERLWKKR